MVASSFEIRVATPGDETGVDTLLQASYPVLMAGAYDATLLEAAVPIMARANPNLLKCGTYYVAAREDASIIGCGGWTPGRPGDGSVEPGLGHVRHFGVHPNATRCGVGRAIFRSCESTARTAGIQRFECYASLNAEAFYAALGFAAVSRGEVAMGPALTLPVVVMTKELR